MLFTAGLNSHIRFDKKTVTNALTPRQPCQQKAVRNTLECGIVEIVKGVFHCFGGLDGWHIN